MWTRIVGVTSARNLVGSVDFMMVSLMTFAIVTMASPAALAKTKNLRKVQEVNFDEMSLKGTIRNPDGAYLVQKRGLKFLPLHQVKKDMDTKIRESSFYVK